MGSNDEKVTKFVLRMPKDIHEKIKAEGSRAKLSMNQIIVHTMRDKYLMKSPVERKLDTLIKLVKDQNVSVDKKGRGKTQNR